MSKEQTQTNADEHESQNSKLAIWSLVCGLISAASPYVGRVLAVELIFLLATFTAPPLFCIASIVLCIMALASIRQSNGKLKGKLLAIVGPAISIAHIILFIIRLAYGPWGGPMHW